MNYHQINEIDKDEILHIIAIFDDLLYDIKEKCWPVDINYNITRASKLIYDLLINVNTVFQV